VEISEPKSARIRAMRVQERFPFEINVGSQSEHHFFAGSTRDISEGGIFVATQLTYEVGSLLEVSLVLPGDESPTTFVTEVRWIRSPFAHGAGGAGLGLRFVDVPPAAMARIRELTRTRESLLRQA
jgi:uncharacterized protein (TIGR02266 family)